MNHSKPQLLKAELYDAPVAPIKTIAIIGGGVASACLAQQILTKAPELKVTLYCKDNLLATGASGNKQGAIYPHLQGSHSVIAELSAECYRYALAFYRQLVHNGIQFQHQWCGVLQQAFTQELEQRYLRVAEVWPELVEYIDAKQSSQLANLSLPFPSLWIPKGGWLAPFEFCQQVLQNLSDTGALSLKLNTQVTSLSRETGKWQLSVAENKTKSEYDAIVVCSGHLSTQFSQTAHLPIEPIRGQVSRLHKASSLSPLSTVLCHKGYITPSQGSYQCFGATFDRDKDSTEPSQEDDKRNLAQLQRVYSEQSWSQTLKEPDIINRKAGIRANSPDHQPIVGQVYSDDWVRQNVDQNNGKMKRLDKSAYRDDQSNPCYQANEWQNLFVFTGLGARGLTTAPLMADYLSDIMLDLPHALPERLVCAVSSKRYQVRELKRSKAKR